jgi:ribosomal protein S14
MLKKYNTQKRPNLELVEKNILKYLKSSDIANLWVKQACLFKKQGGFKLTKFQPYCLVTGRVRFILTEFGTSRLSFQEILNEGNMAGFFN